jgi:DNA-binding response OmpR family regulator
MNKKTKVLIIEDEASLIKALRIKLERSGFTVDIAEDGRKAWKMITKNKYELILLDIVLPLEDGFEFLRKVQENELCLNIYVMTNMSREEEKLRALELGAKGFFVKADTSLASIVKSLQEN